MDSKQKPSSEAKPDALNRTLEKAASGASSDVQKRTEGMRTDTAADIKRISPSLDANGFFLTAEEMRGFSMEPTFESTRNPDVRRLTSLMLRSPDGASVDLLQYLAPPARTAMQVYVRGKSHGENRQEDNIIILDPLEGPHQLGVLMHEIAHAWQETDKKMKRVLSYTSSMNMFGQGFQKHTQCPVSEMEISIVTEMIPGAATLLEGDLEKRFLEITRERDGMVWKRMRASGDGREKKEEMGGWAKLRPFKYRGNAKQLEKLAAREKQLDDRNDEIDAEQKRIFQDPACRIKDVILLPVRILEFDANRMVAVWIERLKRERGIDLSDSYKRKDGKDMTLVQHIDECTHGTYGAVREKIAIRKDDGTDFIPLIESGPSDSSMPQNQ